MKKKVRIAVSLIVGIIVLLFAAYKITYNSLAPMVFDYIMQKNPEAFLKIDEIAGADGETGDENGETDSENADGENGNKSENGENKDNGGNNNSSGNKNGGNASENKESGGKNGYSTHTSIGNLSSADLAKVIKNISPSDKTRIISICKSSVSAADMPRFAKMAKNGMTSEDWAYAERYLRSSLSASQKQEILNIIKKYL